MQQELSEVVVILVGSTVVILLLIVLIIMALFISQRRKFRYQQQLVGLKHTYEQEVLRTQLETQAQTFETISQELHDNVGTLVSMAMVHLNSMEVTEKEKNRCLETNSLLDEAMNILRDISRSLNPENIQKRGLNQSIANELQRLDKTRRFKTDFFTQGKEFAMSSEKQLILFRIVQESLNNVVKHSGGDRVSVSVVFDEPGIEIAIQDNGKGFVVNKDKNVSLTSSGLGNMQKRARLINAVLTIKSELQKGTTVILTYRGDIQKPHESGIYSDLKKVNLSS